MANTILHKRSSTSSAVPSAVSLTIGEIAVNAADAAIFTKKTDNSVVNIVTINKLSAFAATTSSELAGVISDETGSGLLVFGTSPNFLTSVTTSSTSFTLFNANATTITAFGAATTISIGAATGTTTFNSTTASTSSTTGSIVVSGGAGFGRDIYIYGIKVGRGNNGNLSGGETNLAVGANALDTVTPNPTQFGGIQNLAFGTSALRYCSTGTNGQAGYNSAFGTEALLNNTTGAGNIAFGVHALRQTTTGSENCAFGGGPMYQNTTGSYNIAIGSLALYYKTTGSNNVAIGFRAGRNFGTPAGSNYVSAANNCIYIGYDATALANSPTNETVIGYSTVGLGSNTCLINNTSVTETRINGAATSSITTPSTTLSLFNTTATTLNFAGAATTIIMGATSGTTTTIRGGTLVGNTTIQNLFNTTATTLNAFGAATTVSIGAATGTTTVNNNLTVSGPTVQFSDGSQQVTKTPDYLLFNMGIV